jgi:AcrR family transcriptional regulator
MSRPSSSTSALSTIGPKPEQPARLNVASVRREQIIEAAARIIAERGIQDLSLRAIEAETGMSRGQLTYYFKFKEDILLAVFDRMVQRMRERVGTADGPCPAGADPRTMIRSLFQRVLQQPTQADFARLQYTFLAQPGPRNDFRQRLASLYEEWRSHMAADIGRLEPPTAADPRLRATLVQAMLHGLVMQLQADPAAFDRAAMVDLCSTVVAGLLDRNAVPLAANPSMEGCSDG